MVTEWLVFMVEWLSTYWLKVVSVFLLIFWLVRVFRHDSKFALGRTNVVGDDGDSENRSEP